MRALICGSYAYDNIMVFHDRFKNHILPDKVHMLNVSFLVPTMRKEFGGCAGNIAYNLNLLGASAVPMATVGNDFAPYADWMHQNNISMEGITEIKDTFTGQAFITTDMDDNQITAFHPGAMGYSQRNHIFDVNDVQIGIVSPDGKEGMMQHAEEFAAADIPFIFDPGQGLPMFEGDELQTFIEQASWLASNDYESELIQEKTGMSLEQIAQNLDAVVVTKGAQGSTIISQDQKIDIPASKTRKTSDPTGCGDAYRAGLLYGLMRGFGWRTIGQVASLMGAIKIECDGTQNHSFSQGEFEARYLENFGEAISL